jgi:hypothetical protein
VLRRKFGSGFPEDARKSQDWHGRAGACARRWCLCAVNGKENLAGR